MHQGRKLDYDCKKRQQQGKGQVPDKEIKQVECLALLICLIITIIMPDKEIKQVALIIIVTITTLLIIITIIAMLFITIEQNLSSSSRRSNR